MADTISLTEAWWTLLDVIDGVAYLTNPLLGASLEFDATTWPPTLGKRVKDFTRAVARGPRVAKLVGWSAQKVVLARTAIALPAKKYGYRAIGFVDGRLVLVPGHLGRDNKSSPLAVAKAPIAWDGNAWKRLGGDSGPHTQLAGVASGWVIYGGHICQLANDALVAVGELPRADGDWLTKPIEIAGGFAIAVGSLALWRGKKLELHDFGDAKVARVQRAGDKLLVRTAGPHAFWSFDPKTGGSEKLDIDADEVFSAPAGTLALLNNGTELRRLS